MRNRTGVTGKQNSQNGKVIVLTQQQWRERLQNVMLPEDVDVHLRLPNVDLSEGDIDQELDFLG